MSEEQTAFNEAFDELNDAQKSAVEQLDGPVLVIAGPGTGKTQLLSARVANILAQTDSLPQNILCLTFTETGASNMQGRLTKFLGKSAYDVNISTYHGFGADIIRRFPEYFSELRLENPLDEISRYQIISSIVERLSYANPLKSSSHHLNDLISTISEVKRALLSPDDLRAISRENDNFIASANQAIQDIFADFTTMPRSLAKAAPYFDKTLLEIKSLVPEDPVNQRYGSLASLALSELALATAEANELEKTTPLTSWKNNWLVKNGNNEFTLAGELANRRVLALADVLETYQKLLAANGQYDYDDMILRAIEALENNNDLRYTLQEQYLYILLDEYQDTSAAQDKLVQCLTDNPVNNGRPNIMAVGDDDQAIYAFQGALYSNMLDFSRHYKDTLVVNLTENYRSHADILETASNISSQIDGRLANHFDDMSKNITQANDNITDVNIERTDCLSDVAQHDLIARQIKSLIDQGVNKNEIAVLAPKHKYLEPLVPYLNKLDIPVHYEKRENILEAPVIRQIISMSRLVLALANADDMLADSLWAEVLSYDFWNIATSDIWRLSWRIRETKQLTWSQALLDSDDQKFHDIGLLFLSLAGQVKSHTCEEMLDYIIGTTEINPKEKDNHIVKSPLREYYTSDEVMQTQPELFYETLSHLAVLRSKLRDYQSSHTETLQLADLVAFIELYESSDQRMLSTSPYNQQAESIQLMTVYKAKGLEFEHVFLPSCQDDVWGSSVRDNGNKLTLPPNLAPIRHAGDSDDERLRIFFVAITRAKIGLHLFSYRQNYSGKSTVRLKYLDEIEQPDGNFRSLVLPKKYQTVLADTKTPPALELLDLNWRNRHIATINQPELAALLSSRLENLALSPTNLNSFVDTVYGGPMNYFFRTLLRFPEAPSVSGQFGNAIHETLEWCQYQVNKSSKLPPLEKTLDEFEDRLKAKKLSTEQFSLELERGKRALEIFLEQRGQIFLEPATAEQNFSREGVMIGEAHLTGIIDRLEIDKTNKSIVVVDYKTGKSFAKWESDARLHKYRQQLYFYKILIEGSHSYAGYHVGQGRLEFIEPDSSGRCNHLELDFDDKGLEHTRQLIKVVWEHVKQLNFPDISGYPTSLTGIRNFENDLIEGKI